MGYIPIWYGCQKASPYETPRHRHTGPIRKGLQKALSDRALDRGMATRVPEAHDYAAAYSAHLMMFIPLLYGAEYATWLHTSHGYAVCPVYQYREESAGMERGEDPTMHRCTPSAKEPSQGCIPMGMRMHMV